MQEQSSELGAGGNALAASQLEPTVGQDRATVLVGV